MGSVPVAAHIRRWTRFEIENGVTMRAQLLRFNGAVECDAAIDAWMREHGGELGAIAHEWFELMRKCGDEVLEIVHDGCPVACLITHNMESVTP
jgi:hypothetical protein